MLKTKLVALTEGLVYLRTLIWKGRSRKAPETPLIDVKKDTNRATRGGIKIYVLTPETGNSTFKKSMGYYT
ncbi:MAG: hypothetical protein WA104_08050 [Thermodesulfovibrionales bacterium]